MQHDDAAAFLEALGHPFRLAIYRRLVRAGPSGLTVGQIQDEFGVAGSTLSHHLKTMTRIGALEQDRRGTRRLCRVDYALMDALIAFLTAECCTDGDLEDC